MCRCAVWVSPWVHLCCSNYASGWHCAPGYTVWHSQSVLQVILSLCARVARCHDVDRCAFLSVLALGDGHRCVPKRGVSAHVGCHSAGVERLGHLLAHCLHRCVECGIWLSLSQYILCVCGKTGMCYANVAVAVHLVRGSGCGYLCQRMLCRFDCHVCACVWTIFGWSRATRGSACLAECRRGSHRMCGVWVWLWVSELIGSCESLGVGCVVCPCVLGSVSGHAVCEGSSPRVLWCLGVAE